MVWILKSVMFMTLLLIATATSACGAGLRVEAIRYEPSPVEIGQYFTLWIKVENIGSGRADDLSLELVPSYPFSLDPNESAIKNIGNLPDDIAVFEYHLYVDETAKPGTRELKVRYQDNKGSGWINKSFNISIGSDAFDSKGTLHLQQIKTEPEVLMPGDRGIIILTLKNTASQYSIRLDGKDYDTNAMIQSASLLSTDDIIVNSDTYHETGILGPGDTVNLSYNVEVAENAVCSTKHLEFKVAGSSHSYNYNWDVPVKVDSASVRVIPSKPLIINNGIGTLEFDVANTNYNTLSSVSIKPQAEGIEFSPAEYFIGSMHPDELFTIEFETRAVNVSTPKQLTLTARYRNGNNLHTTEVDGMSLSITSDKQQNNSGLAGVGALFALFAISGVVIYRRKKQQK